MTHPTPSPHPPDTADHVGGGRRCLGILAVIVAAAVCIRAAIGIGLDGRVHFPDSHDYIAVARNILAGKGPIVTETSRAKRAPGYGYFLAAIFAAAGDAGAAEGDAASEIDAPLLPVRLIQALMGGALCVGVYLIGSRLFGPAAGLAAAALAAFDPFLAYFSGLILTEVPFALLLVAGFACLLKTEGGSVGYSVAAGVCLGAAALVRLSVFPMLPSTAVVWAVLQWRKPGSLRTAAIVAAVSVLVLVPWAIRNQRQTGEFTFATLSGGMSLYEGTYPGADGGPAIDKIDWPAELDGMGEAEKDAALYDAAVGFILDDPLRILRLAAVKLVRFWSIFPNFSEYRRPLVMAVSAAWMIPVMVLTAAGLVMQRRRLRTAGVLLVPAVWFSALHSIFVGSIRYRAPVMPLLVIFAGAAAARIMMAAHGRGK